MDIYLPLCEEGQRGRRKRLRWKRRRGGGACLVEGCGLLEGWEEGWWQPWQLGGAPSAGGTYAAWRTASWGLHLEETGG